MSFIIHIPYPEEPDKLEPGVLVVLVAPQVVHAAVPVDLQVIVEWPRRLHRSSVNTSVHGHRE